MGDLVAAVVFDVQRGHQRRPEPPRERRSDRRPSWRPMRSTMPLTKARLSVAAVLLRQLDGLVHRDGAGDVVGAEELEGREPEDRAVDHGHPVQAPVGAALLDDLVDLGTVFVDAEHQALGKGDLVGLRRGQIGQALVVHGGGPHLVEGLLGRLGVDLGLVQGEQGVLTGAAARARAAGLGHFSPPAWPAGRPSRSRWPRRRRHCCRPWCPHARWPARWCSP